MTLSVKQQFKPILKSVFRSSWDAPELLVGVFPSWFVLRCLVLEIEPGEDSAADTIVGERLHGEHAEVVRLVPFGVQDHPVALLQETFETIFG